MADQHDTSTIDDWCIEDEDIWIKLYPHISAYVRAWIRHAQVSSWKGQEADIAEDITQEAIYRLYQYAQRTQRGEISPISDPRYMSIVIARNCFIDKRRKELRLILLSLNDDMTEEHCQYRSNSFSIIDPSEIVCEKLYHEWLFQRISILINSFPEKQRTALLTDLANRMDFAKPRTPLQRAFQKEGIRLEAYRQPVPSNAAERNRYSSALSTAYRRLGNQCRQYLNMVGERSQKSHAM